METSATDLADDPLFLSAVIGIEVAAPRQFAGSLSKLVFSDTEEFNNFIEIWYIEFHSDFAEYGFQV